MDCFDVFFLESLEVVKDLILKVSDLLGVLLSSIFIEHIDDTFQVAHDF